MFANEIINNTRFSLFMAHVVLAERLKILIYWDKLPNSLG